MSKSQKRHDHVGSHGSAVELSIVARTIIGVTAGTMLLLFGWLKLRGFPLGVLVKDENAEHFFRISLIFLYWSWVAGTRFDLNLQVVVFKGSNAMLPKPHLQAFTFIIVISVLFIILALIRTPKHFLFFFILFIVANLLIWRFYLAKYLNPLIGSSKEDPIKDQDYLELEELNCIERFIAGRWQWWRFGLMLSLLSVLFASTFGGLLTSAVDRLGYLSEDFLLALIFIILFCMFEGSIWFERLRTYFSIKKLAELKKYNLSLKD